MNEIASLLGELVAIDSINPDLVPGGAGEAAIARFVAHWLEQAGLAVEIDEPVPGRPSVVAIARGTGGGQSLMLNAHMDTVGVAGMERPHDPVVQGSRLYGRAAFDMKGGLAAIMFAAATAKNQQLRGDVILTAVSDEEYASMGTASIVKRWHADAAIVTEPTGLEIETRGIAAHGSLPDLGVDAIVKMGKVLVGLEELDRSLRSAPSHRLLGSGSLHASLISCGQELSSYPERCILSVERRTVPGETAQDVESQVRQILDQLAASDTAFNAALRTTLLREAFEVSQDEPIVQAVRRHVAAIPGQEPGIIGATAWMDSAILSAAGIPTVIFGPGV